MKVSLICPIYNEKDSVEELMKSMLSQTKKPDEIIFVDSFSKDGTAEIIKDYSKKHKEIKLIQEKSNISKARNIAVRNSKYDIIAATDASCKLDKDWLKNITLPFEEKEVGIVSGGFIAVAEKGIEKYIAMITVKPMDEWKEETFLPSGRSIAFRKKVWEAVGGYPEQVYTGEDTLFDLKLKEKKFKFKLARDAIVYWKGRETIKKFSKQFYLYGKGDGEAGNLKKIGFNLLSFLGFNFWIFFVASGFILKPIVSLALIVLLILYFGFGGFVYAIKKRNIGCLFWITILTAVKRLSYFAGVWRGLI